MNGKALVFITKQRRQGFTLVEVIVVVAILAILAAIAVPVFANLNDRAKQGTAIASATEIANAINLYNHANMDAMLMQGDVSGWASESDVQAVLEGLTPVIKPDNFAEAMARVTVNGDGIATVSTTIN